MATLNARAQTLGCRCSIQGISFEAGTQVFFGLADELVLCVLPVDQPVSDVPCQKGLVHFHPNGTLAQATLATDHSLRGVAFRAGAQLTWNEDGTLGAHLPAPFAIESVVVPAGASLRIDDAGKLVSWSRRLVIEETVDGIPCEAGSVLTCFASGRPERLTLARYHRVDGLAAMAGTDLELHGTGKVAVVTLGEESEVAGILFENGTTLVFRPDGTLSVAQLAEDLEIAGKTYSDGTHLLFDEAGRMTGHAAITWEVLRPERA